MGDTPEINNNICPAISPLSVILPIHQSNNSLMPFVHALKLALLSKGELEIIDVRTEQEAVEHIGVRAILEKWGALPSCSRRSDVLGTGLRIKKIVKPGNKKHEIVKRLSRHAHDLLVIGTQSNHSGLGNLFGRDLAEYLADYFRHTTLFIPSGARPFVEECTGAITLKKIIIPVENSTFLYSALKSLRKILSLIPNAGIQIIGLHAGAKFPVIDPAHTDGFDWRPVLSSETILTAILNCVKENDADLIVMATNGRNTLSQKIIGSHTEQVLRNSTCPLLSISV